MNSGNLIGRMTKDPRSADAKELTCVQPFDITPTVSIIGPAADLLIVLQDLHDAFFIAEEYHEEYGQWEHAYKMRRMKDMIYAKITAIKPVKL